MAQILNMIKINGLSDMDIFKDTPDGLTVDFGKIDRFLGDNHFAFPVMKDLHDPKQIKNDTFTFITVNTAPYFAISKLSQKLGDKSFVHVGEDLEDPFRNPCKHTLWKHGHITKEYESGYDVKDDLKPYVKEVEPDPRFAEKVLKSKISIREAYEASPDKEDKFKAQPVHNTDAMHNAGVTTHRSKNITINSIMSKWGKENNHGGKQDDGYTVV